MHRSSKSTIHYIRSLFFFWIGNDNNREFMEVIYYDLIDLPSLKSITLGKFALSGKPYDESCSLIMRSISIDNQFDNI